MATEAPTVRPETAGDHEEITRVVTAAFGSDVEARLVEALRASDDYIPGLSMVADLDGRVVGHVMISYAAIEGDDGRRRPVASLAPLAVEPGLQRRGIGSALMREVVAAADRLGEPLVVLQGDPGYYGRHGFEPSERHGITLPLPSWARREAAQVRRLAGYDPSIRGRVVYPPAFDQVEDT